MNIRRGAWRITVVIWAIGALALFVAGISRPPDAISRLFHASGVSHCMKEARRPNLSRAQNIKIGQEACAEQIAQLEAFDRKEEQRQALEILAAQIAWPLFLAFLWGLFLYVLRPTYQWVAGGFRN